MSSALYQLGHRSYRARRLVVVLWLVALAVIGLGAGVFGKGTSNALTIPGTESQAALDALSNTFPEVSGSNAQVVVVAPDGLTVDDPSIATPVSAAVAGLGTVPGVKMVTDPQSTVAAAAVSADKRAEIITAQLDRGATDVTDTMRADIRAQVDELRRAVPPGTTVSLGGSAFSIDLPHVGATEGLGVVIAFIVLVVTFASFLAAGMPLLTAIFGVAVTTAGIFLMTAFTTISSTTPLLSLMLGLAVGIDYSLFIVSRHLDQIRHGMDPQESAARSVATAGSAVVFAGLTVIIALIGLAVTRIPFLTIMGLAAAAGVAMAVAVSLTLTPALLGFAGGRLRRRLGRRGRTAPAPAGTAHALAGTAQPDTGHPGQPHAGLPHTGQPGQRHAGQPDTGHGARAVPSNRFLAGWVRLATAKPVVTIAVIVVGLMALALPARELRLALPDSGSKPVTSEVRQTYDLISEHFGPGYNGPLIVTGSILNSTDPLGLMADLKAEIERLPGVAAVPVATPNRDADTGIVQVIPDSAPDSPATEALVHELRSLRDTFTQRYGFTMAVTGMTAAAIDVSAQLGAALLPFALFVVGLSLILLTVVFRSIWVPVKATVGYLLSVAAAMGVVVMVFQWGWGAALLNIDRTGPVISFMPIIVMGVLFGLAMDYEVFLVARMREEHVHGSPAREAVRRGFLGSGKVVIAAALIMFSVFVSFVTEGDINIKPIGLALAVGVFIDAFVVRMTLVPAVMDLLGERAWFLPRRLDRQLPVFDVEGEAIERELTLAHWPPGGAELAVAADAVHMPGVPQPVDVMLPRGSVLVVTADSHVAAANLTLCLSGRLAPIDGRLKVDGLLLPGRSGTVRSRVAIALLDHSADPVAAVARTVADQPPIVILDSLDRVTGADDRDRIGRLLTAWAGGARSLIVTTRPGADVTAMLPGDPMILRLDELVEAR